MSDCFINDSLENKINDCNILSLNQTEKFSLRIRIENLPPFFSPLQIRKFLNKIFPGIEYSRLKCMKQVAILNFSKEEDVVNALDILNATKIKKFSLSAKRVGEETIVNQEKSKKKHQQNLDNATALELVTPLAGLTYLEQLEKKFLNSKTIVANLVRQISKTGVNSAYSWKNCLKKVLPSPSVTEYRNKCEFSIAKETLGEDKGLSCVGFVKGRMVEKEYSIMKVDECINLSKNTLKIVHHFQEFIRNFNPNLEAFDEFKREGFWKMLTIRDFLGDCMMIVTVHPHQDSLLVKQAKEALISKFIKFGNADKEIEFIVTSLYWQTIENASDKKIYEHLAGTPYIYETLLGAQFRISPSTFFQTNSRAAEVLYTQIGDALLIPCTEVENACFDDLNGNDDINNNDDDNEPKSSNFEICKNNENNYASCEKKPRHNTEETKINNLSNDLKLSSTIILDICCGAGTISICLMKRIEKLIQQNRMNGLFGCIGIEIIPEAIHDAKINASNNGFSKKNCKYFVGQAETVFKNLNYYMPDDCKFENANILGVLDPPRAGVTDKVIISCRKLQQLKRLVYVSCDPKAAIKNLTDLCRPTSNKFEGDPFEILSIQPIDMFPQTEHFEWVVTLKKKC